MTTKHLTQRHTHHPLMRMWIERIAGCALLTMLLLGGVTQVQAATFSGDFSPQKWLPAAVGINPGFFEWLGHDPEADSAQGLKITGGVNDSYTSVVRGYNAGQEQTFSFSYNLFVTGTEGEATAYFAVNPNGDSVVYPLIGNGSLSVLVPAGVWVSFDLLSSLPESKLPATLTITTPPTSTVPDSSLGIYGVMPLLGLLTFRSLKRDKKEQDSNGASK